jgi:hypothetical protein
MEMGGKPTFILSDIAEAGSSDQRQDQIVDRSHRFANVSVDHPILVPVVKQKIRHTGLDQ